VPTTVNSGMKFEELNLLEVGHTIGMSGVIFSGPEKSFVIAFPDERLDKPLEPLEMNLEQWQAFLRQTDLLETEILTKAADGTIAKAIVRKSQRNIDAHTSWKVFKRDGYKCCYCGRDDAPLTVDHLVLWEDGGPSTEQNMLSSCRKCNKARGNTAYADWLHHPVYRRVSGGISPERRTANEALLGTLATIPRTMHTRSR